MRRSVTAPLGAAIGLAKETGNPARATCVRRNSALLADGISAPRSTTAVPKVYVRGSVRRRTAAASAVCDAAAGQMGDAPQCAAPGAIVD